MFYSRAKCEAQCHATSLRPPTPSIILLIQSFFFIMIAQAFRYKNILDHTLTWSGEGNL